MSLTELPVIDRPGRAAIRRDLAACTRRWPRPIARRGPLRSAQPGPLLHRRQRLPDRARWASSSRGREADVVGRGRRPAPGFGVPLTARGGGTSQAGQAIGPGVILDSSKYFNRVLEINAAERWARVQPGCVLDDLNRALQAARPAVRPRHLDRQPRHHRRHDRQQLLRRALGHLRQDDRSCARAEGRAGRRQRRRTCGPLDDAELEAKCRQADLEGACYRAVRRLAARARRARSSAASRRSCAASAATTSTRFVPTRRADGAVQPGPALRRLGGHARRRRRGEAPAGRRCRGPRRCSSSSSPTCSTRWPRRRSSCAHRPSAVEVMDQLHPRQHAAQPRGRPAARLPRRAIPAPSCSIEFYGDRAEELPPRLDALEADLRATRLRLPLSPRDRRRPRRRASGSCARLALGLSMAEKGDAKAISFVEDTAVAPEHLRDYIAEFLAIIARHGTTAGRLRPRLGRLPARPAGRST